MRCGRESRRHRLAFRTALVAAATALLATAAQAESIGIDTATMPNGPVNCSGEGCHTVASEAVFVTITGPTALEPGETADYTIAMFQNVPGGLKVGAGVNVVAIVDGVLTDLEDGILGEDALASQITQDQVFPMFLATGQLTHFAALATAVGKFSYDFTVTAPDEPGSLELRGAMNTFDNNGNQDGDLWNGTSLFVTIPEPTATAGGVAALVGLSFLSALSRPPGPRRPRRPRRSRPRPGA